ncbi:ATP-binding protein [Aneurinibacillus sp. REN35]|uniref:ATP-binding protein n=1 Tax=Aneurinibacillus sp. REN35 TaxID=3237286 RepID=UPI00352986AE
MITQETLYIQISKQNCANIGLDPYTIPHPTAICNTELKQIKKQYEEILSTINFFTKKMLFFVNEQPLVFIVTDQHATVLDMYGDESIIHFVQNIGIRLGIQFSEEEMGTNSINLALEQKHPVKVLGTQHYHDHLSQAACYTIPFSYDSMNNLTGSLTIFTDIENANDIYLGMLLAIADSVERELLLRKKNQRLFLLNQIMMNKTKNGIILTDSEGYIIDVNPYMEKITGRKRKELLGFPVTTIECLGTYMHSTLEHEHIHEDIVVEFHEDNPQQKIICLLDTLPIYDEKNTLHGAYGQVRNITDMKNLEKKVTTSEKFSVIGKLAAGFAHEIRNPLTSISGFIHLLKETLTQEDKHHYYLNIIQSELDRVKTLVTSFIATAKPDVPMKKEVEIKQIITETIALMKSHASLHDVIIEYSMPAALIFLYVDAMQIKQVMMNLIQNAIEAMPDGGTIRICIEETNEQTISIIIEDNGCGMTPMELDQIMHPFFTTKEDGLGLGLSISYQIIESHKGSLHVFSEKGKGTTFTVSLPKIIEKE